MKNYYDELEVSPSASKEVIERVYKVLAKKYHPDTTQELDKYAAEEKFKSISEAYEILSNDEKRQKYDLELKQSNPNISYEDYVNMVKERDSLNNALNNLKSEFNQTKKSNSANQQYYNTSQSQYNQTNTSQQYSNNASAQYNQSHSDFNGNNYYNPNTSQGYSNSNYNTKSKKKTYYYTNTGKPASAFAYYKYKIKQFFQNIGLLILAIIAIILAINAFLNYSLF